MILDQYKEHIDELVNQGHGNKIVVFGSDDEGNRFSDVHHSPDLMSIEDMSEYDGVAEEEDVVICIN